MALPIRSEVAPLRCLLSYDIAKVGKILIRCITRSNLLRFFRIKGSKKRMARTKKSGGLPPAKQTPMFAKRKTNYTFIAV